MVSRWALGALLLQLALAAWVGERFPISRYSMYASNAPHERGAVPVVLANGEPADVEDFVDFSGLDLVRWSPPEPCSLEYILADARRWIEAHPGSGGDVEIGLAFVVVTLADGALHEETVVLQRGRARRAAP